MSSIAVSSDGICGSFVVSPHAIDHVRSQTAVLTIVLSDMAAKVSAAPKAGLSAALSAAAFNATNCTQQPARISSVNRIILHVSITIERLRITKLVAALVWIRLIEARPPAVITTMHCVVCTIVIAFVVCEPVHLEGTVAGPVRVAAKGIDFNGADNGTGAIRDPLALHHRILMYPVHAALLHRQ